MSFGVLLYITTKSFRDVVFIFFSMRGAVELEDWAKVTVLGDEPDLQASSPFSPFWDLFSPSIITTKREREQLTRDGDAPFGQQRQKKFQPNVKADNVNKTATLPP